MNIGEMSKGDIIELEVKCNGKSMTFESELELILTNCVLIKSIKVNKQTIGFNKTCRISLIYKKDGNVYLWEKVIVKLVQYKDEIYHQIDLYGDGKPYNRRDAYRQYVGEDMTVLINTANGPSALSVLVKDISETGVGFITKEELDVSRTFRLKFKDGNTYISISGIIVRKERLEHLDSYLYGCKFIEKNNALFKFIARKQGEQLKGKSQLYSSKLHRDTVMS